MYTQDHIQLLSTGILHEQQVEGSSSTSFLNQPASGMLALEKDSEKEKHCTPLIWSTYLLTPIWAARRKFTLYLRKLSQITKVTLLIHLLPGITYVKRYSPYSKYCLWFRGKIANFAYITTFLVDLIPILIFIDLI